METTPAGILQNIQRLSRPVNWLVWLMKHPLLPEVFRRLPRCAKGHLKRFLKITRRFSEVTENFRKSLEDFGRLSEEFWRFPNIIEDCRKWTEDFLSVLRGLWTFLEIFKRVFIGPRYLGLFNFSVGVFMNSVQVIIRRVHKLVSFLEISNCTRLGSSVTANQPREIRQLWLLFNT